MDLGDGYLIVQLDADYLVMRHDETDMVWQETAWCATDEEAKEFVVADIAR